MLQLRDGVRVAQVVLAAPAPLVVPAGVELAVEVGGDLEGVLDGARGLARDRSRPTPPMRDAVQVKYLSTTSWLSPIASKICAPR